MSRLKRGADAPVVENFHNGETGKTRDKIGAFCGLSGRTMEKIAEVCDAAEADPEGFGDLPGHQERQLAHRKLRKLLFTPGRQQR